eukprot:maker-scaffold2178_size19279-snap-gene-0.0 protein:Tk07620 transcript:maker-scaffold2178_size19279-snap-gene-0.0-mRNA-1 annotation:"hypothetical protein"
MMSDDQGYGDIGAHGNPYLKTPNIEKIGMEGMEMHQFVGYPNCSASRAAIMTGRYPYRTGVTAVTQVDHFMRADETTIAEVLGANGYRTAVDDLRPELGCYGSETAISPNIDQLAKRGILFNKAYCQQAICGPSRASILTGIRPESSGVFHNYIKFRESNPNVVTLPQHFGAQGYQTVYCGKIFHHDKASKEKPNILFIAVDDLRPELGCYGSEIAITPNFDRLAKQSMLFERAYCQEAICSPSRASLMTGARPESINVIENFTYFRDENPNIITIPQQLRTNGYETVYTGYNDLGFMGSKDIPTPALDQLAENGTIFTSAYAAHPFCGPSRASLMTGRYAHKIGSQFNLPPNSETIGKGIPLSETFISKVLQSSGYNTGVIGKWHLGATEVYHPNKRGFDNFYGFLGGGHNYHPEEYETEYKRQKENGRAVIFEYLLPLEQNGKEVREK